MPVGLEFWQRTPGQQSSRMFGRNVLQPLFQFFMLDVFFGGKKEPKPPRCCKKTNKFGPSKMQDLLGG